MNNSTKASQGKLRRNAPEHRVKYFESYFFPIQKEVRRQLDFTNDSWLLDAAFCSGHFIYISPPYNRIFKLSVKQSLEFSIAEKIFITQSLHTNTIIN